MTTELAYLFLSALLLSLAWIPHIVGQVMTSGLPTPDDYTNLREQSAFPAWVRRANRAHVNLVEQFGAGRSKAMDRSFVGSRMRSRHMRSAVVSPSSAISTAFLSNASASTTPLARPELDCGGQAGSRSAVSCRDASLIKPRRAQATLFADLC